MPPLSSTSNLISNPLYSTHVPLAQQAMKYLDASTDPFHAVQTSILLLREAGFEHLPESIASTAAGDTHSSSSYSHRLRRGGKYYFERNKSTLVAFRVGSNYQPGRGGFVIVGGHSDSPNLKVKTRSKRSGSSGCIQIGVECYGGGLWHTWFDRDLGISGRVMVRNPTTHGIEQRLVRIPRPILRISNLAIHLRTEEERKAFAVNKEDHLSPILAMAAQQALTAGSKGDDEIKMESSNNDVANTTSKENNDNTVEEIEPNPESSSASKASSSSSSAKVHILPSIKLTGFPAFADFANL